MKKKHRTIFSDIADRRHDEDFEAENRTDFHPTSERPGSSEKLNILAKRAELGQPLFHEHDFHCGGTGSYIGTDGPGIKCCPSSSTLSGRKDTRE